MNRVTEAFRWFFSILFGTGLQDIQQLQQPKQKEAAADGPSATVTEAINAETHQQNGARLFLATLQQESRLVDFLMEDIQPFEDAQIGAAVRQVHEKASRFLRDGMGIEPMRSEGEGAVVTVARNERAAYTLVGQVGGNDELTGTLRHHGWKATRDVPLPSVDSVNVSVVAKAEVEVNG